MPITAEQRERLLSRPLAVLSRDGRHWITPYVDDARRAEPDLDVAAPCNRWRTALELELRALERAAWRLAQHAPPSLRELRTKLVTASRGGSEAQNVAHAEYEAALERVRADVRRCGASAAAVTAALAELDG